MPGRVRFTAAEKEAMSRIMKAAHRRAGNGDGRSTPKAERRDRKTAAKERRRKNGRFA